MRVVPGNKRGIDPAKGKFMQDMQHSSDLVAGHAELVAENARLRATLQQIHDLADGLLNDIEAEEALA